MKILFTIGLAFLTLIHAAPRSKHTAYDLPSRAALIVGDVRTTFVCRKDGYYADQDNFCKIFHICHTIIHPDGTPEMVQWSFFCGNMTIFNQFSLTCSYPEDAIPCGNVRDFWFLNDNIGIGPNVPFHSKQNVIRAVTVAKYRASHPLKVERIPQFFRPSLPITTVKPRIWQPYPLAADRALPSKVLDSHSTTRPPSMHSPLRPHAMPLLLPPPPMAVEIACIKSMSQTAPPRPDLPSDEEVMLILNE